MSKIVKKVRSFLIRINRKWNGTDNLITTLDYRPEISTILEGQRAFVNCSKFRDDVTPVPKEKFLVKLKRVFKN